MWVLQYFFAIVWIFQLFQVVAIQGEVIETVDAPDQEYCWENENYTVQLSCHICSSDDIAIHNECFETGFIENIICEKHGSAVKSCPRDKHRDLIVFWKFEVSMIILSILTATAVMLRTRKLDRENVERIQRQISAL